ncbi:glycosyl transferase [Clostridia bacterium]|nr:glycosyl transferase [Clostridia bacterium]
MPKFSVVVPLFNKEKYIEKTINSILIQTFTNYELIIIDDGSTDNSLAIAKQFHDDRIVIYEQSNVGTTSTRNNGVKYSNSDFVVFLDADDEWTTEYLETIDSLVSKFPEANMFSTAYWIKYGNDRIKYSNRAPSEEPELLNFWSSLLNAYDVVLPTITTIRKQAIISAGYFAPGEKTGGDLDLFSRIASSNTYIAYSHKRCGYWNKSADNNNRTRNPIANASSFMKQLFIESEKMHTPEEIAGIKHKYKLKMIVYIYTTIVFGEATKARELLGQWNFADSIIIKTMLYCASYLPKRINISVYSLRMQVY